MPKEGSATRTMVKLKSLPICDTGGTPWPSIQPSRIFTLDQRSERSSTPSASHHILSQLVLTFLRFNVNGIVFSILSSTCSSSSLHFFASALNLVLSVSCAPRFKCPPNGDSQPNPHDCSPLACPCVIPLLISFQDSLLLILSLNPQLPHHGLPIRQPDLQTTLTSTSPSFTSFLSHHPHHGLRGIDCIPSPA